MSLQCTFVSIPCSYLFWTDREFGRVERSDLSGEDRVVLASSPSPTSLTIDVSTGALVLAGCAALGYMDVYTRWQQC